MQAAIVRFGRLVSRDGVNAGFPRTRPGAHPGESQVFHRSLSAQAGSKGTRKQDNECEGPPQFRTHFCLSTPSVGPGEMWALPFNRVRENELSGPAIIAMSRCGEKEPGRRGIGAQPACFQEASAERSALLQNSNRPRNSMTRGPLFSPLK